MMNLTIRDLRLVQTVADEGTLTGAARRLFLTQSALSHQLADLEARARLSVFSRSGRRMVPTAAGLRMLHSANALLHGLRDLEDELRAIALGRSGVLRLTTQCYTSYRWLPLVLPSFALQHPGIDVQIVPDAASRPGEAVRAGEVDLALVYDLPEDPRWVARPLFEDELVMLVAPSHAYAGRTHVEARDFADQHLLLYLGQREESFFHRRVLTPAGVTPRRISEVRLTEGIVALAASGIGVAVMSRWAAAAEIASGQLVGLRIGRKGLGRHWQAVMLPSAAEVGAMKTFVRLLQPGPGVLEGIPGSEGATASRVRAAS